MKLGDKAAAEKIISFGVSVDDATDNYGTVVHFFIDCLEDNTEPNLDLLELLLEKVSDVNLVEAEMYTSLEYALRHMAIHNCFYWEVVELLLKKGVRITEEYPELTPFNVLRCQCQVKSLSGRRGGRTLSEEMCYLNTLAKYCQLEKNYHPNTQSGFTLEEFKKCSSAMRATLNIILAEGGTADFLSGAIAEVCGQLPNNWDIQCSHAQADIVEEQRKVGVSVRQTLLFYHNWFGKLVVGAEFKECFEENELNAIRPFLEGDSPEAIVLQHFL